VGTNGHAVVRRSRVEGAALSGQRGTAPQNRAQVHKFSDIMKILPFICRIPIPIKTNDRVEAP